MITVIVRTDDASMAANVGGSVHTVFKTFEIDAPDLERYLNEKMYNTQHRQVVGVELKTDLGDTG